MWTPSLRDNRATRRKYKVEGHGKQQPIDLGIKQYKREHGNDRKRVLYYKVEMWKAFHEFKEK